LDEILKLHLQVMNKVTAEILTIGDELLYGQIADTNSQWIGVELSNAGIHVVRKTTVGDIERDILNAFAEAETRADIILITGGLGPTSDDLTKPCLAKYFDCEMRIHEEALAEVTEFFKSRGRALTELNLLQASLPVCCEKITNRMGTAPGMWFQRDGKVFVSMPGVPHEMKCMMREIIIPKLRETFKTPTILHSIIRTVGIGESFLAEKISSWEQAIPAHIRLAYLPGYGEVKLRLTGVGTNSDVLKNELASLIEKIKPLAGEYIYGMEDDPLEFVVGGMLRDKKLRLAIAESCTGGYLSHLITSIPGSSDYFLGGVVAYSNEIKITDLGVKPETLEHHGAVSEATIKEMASLVRLKFSADIGVATSGIAGPGGGTPEKPVGTVWIAYADSQQIIARKLQLSKDRLINIKIASIQLLNLIRTTLQNLK
jgi:nicotinamide-nucleotide amidase